MEDIKNDLDGGAGPDIVEAAILKFLDRDGFNPWYLEAASLWRVVTMPERRTLGVEMLVSGRDIYGLLDFTPDHHLGDRYAVITTGWAAPIDESGPPSQSRLRRRCRLLLVAGYAGIDSLLRMGDDPDKAITDEGHGALREAVEALYTRALMGHDWSESL
jgi:hypothetical protein